MTQPSNHISAVRQMLLATMADLRNPDKPMDLDRARAIGEVAQVAINVAKVEVDYIKATGQDRLEFLETPPDAHVAHLGQIPASGYTQGNVERLPGVTRHTLKV